MLFNDIKKRASNETDDLITPLREVLNSLEKTNYFEREFTKDIADQIESICSDIDIPCCRVHDNCLSFAKTYKLLYIYESRR